MPKNKTEGFKPGQVVVVHPNILICPNKTGKIIGRTGLDVEHLSDGKITVDQLIDGGQLQLKHPRLGSPFIVHSKYFVQHQIAQQQAAAA